MATPPKVGTTAPEFSLPDSTGAEHALSSYLKEGNVLLVFFRGLW